MTTQRVLKVNEYRSDFYIIFCGKKLFAQTTDFIFHSTQWRPYIPDDVARNAKATLASASGQYSTSGIEDLQGSADTPKPCSALTSSGETLMEEPVRSNIDPANYPRASGVFGLFIVLLLLGSTVYLSVYYLR